MKSTISIILFLLLNIQFVFTQADTTKVLFLGNSFTFANDLPEIFKQLAMKGGKKVYVESNTPGGYTLSGHSQNQASLQLINSTNWDYVVLQEQSQIPSWIPDRDTLMYPFAIILDSLIHVNHLCTKTMFFMTWAHKNGDLGLPAGSDTYEAMQQRLRSGYMQIADSLDAEVTPAGWVWRHVRQNYPSVELYSSDNYHPALEGTYLAACSFYAMIFQQNPFGINYSAGINDTLFPILQHIAGNIVLDSLTLWNKNIYNPNPTATFSHYITGFDVNFTNTSILSTSYAWDFGDGQTSNLENPSHVYSDTGTFIVQLIASNECATDTTTVTIQILTTSIEKNSELKKVLYPNPFRETINIEGNSAETIEYQIFDNIGRICTTGKILEKQKSTLNLEYLKPGIYQINLSNSTGTKSFKIVKL